MGLTEDLTRALRQLVGALDDNGNASRLKNGPELVRALDAARRALDPPASGYPEHDKLAAIRDQSQAQGELLEWLSSHGVRLMTWHEFDEPVQEPCWKCLHVTEASEQRCRESKWCSVCAGEHVVTHTQHREGWVPDGRPTERLLADFHEIDLKKIEAEKRAMLDRQREINKRELEGEWAST